MPANIEQPHNEGEKQKHKAYTASIETAARGEYKELKLTCDDISRGLIDLLHKIDEKEKTIAFWTAKELGPFLRDLAGMGHDLEEVAGSVRRVAPEVASSLSEKVEVINRIADSMADKAKTFTTEKPYNSKEDLAPLEEETFWPFSIEGISEDEFVRKLVEKYQRNGPQQSNKTAGTPGEVINTSADESSQTTAPVAPEHTPTQETAPSVPGSTEEPATPEAAPSPAKKIKGGELRTEAEEIVDAFERKFEREEKENKEKRKQARANEEVKREKNKPAQDKKFVKPVVERVVPQPETRTQPKVVVQPEKEIKTIQSFAEVQTLDELYASLRARRGQLEALGGKQGKTRQFSYAEVAGFLKERAQEFDDEVRTGDKRGKIEGFLSSFVDPEVQTAMRRAFVNRGWVIKERRATRQISTRGQEGPQETPVAVLGKEAFDSAFGPILNKVKNTPSFTRYPTAHGQYKLVTIEGEKFATSLRDKLAEFASDKFKRLVPKEKDERATRFISTIAENPELQNDLRDAFVRLGILTAKGGEDFVPGSSVSKTGASGTETFQEVEERMRADWLRRQDRVYAEIEAATARTQAAKKGRAAEKSSGSEEIKEKEAYTPEALAAFVHTERTLQEKLIADFAVASFSSPSEAIKKGIEIIKALRLSLERQAAVVEKAEKAKKSSLARLQIKQLSVLLNRIIDVRSRGEQIIPAELVNALRSIFKLGDISQPAVENAPAPVPAPAPAPPTTEAPKSEQITAVPSPSAEIAKPILEAPTFDAGKAMDVEGFPEFLVEAGNSGEDEAVVRKHFEAFAMKDTVAKKVAALYTEKISVERGIQLGDDGAEAVRAHLEQQARANPEAVKELAGKFERFDKLSADVAGLNSQFASERGALLTPEQLQAKTAEQAELQHKKEVLDLAVKTQRFLPNWRRLFTDPTGWGWMAGAVSKEAAVARETARSAGMAHHGAATFFTAHLMTLSSGKMKAGLAALEKEITAGAEKMKAYREDTAMLALIEQKKREAEVLVDTERQRIVFDKGLTDTLVGIANKKLNKQLATLESKGADANLDEAKRVFELLEKAEKAHIKEPSGVHLKDINPKKGMEAIETMIEASIGRQIEQAFADNKKITSGRFSALENVLEGFVAKGKLGKKGKLAIRKFIVKRLTEAFNGLDNKAQPKAILIKTLIARQIRKINEENPPPPPPPPSPQSPPEAPPVLPAVPPVSPAIPPSPSVLETATVSSATPIPEKASVSIPAAKETAPETPHVSTPISQADNVNWVASEYVPWTFEETARMTFSDVMKSNPVVLGEVMRDIPADDLVNIFSEESSDLVNRVRGVLTEGEREVFDGLLDRRKREINSVAAEEIFKKKVENLKKKVVEIAKRIFARKKTKPPVSSPVETAPVPEPPPVAEEKPHEVEASSTEEIQKADTAVETESSEASEGKVEQKEVLSTAEETVSQDKGGPERVDSETETKKDAAALFVELQRLYPPTEFLKIDNDFHREQADDQTLPKEQVFDHYLNLHKDELQRHLPSTAPHFHEVALGLGKTLEKLRQEGTQEAELLDRFAPFVALAERLSFLAKEKEVDIRKFMKGYGALRASLFGMGVIEGKMRLFSLFLREAEKELAESGIEV